MKKLVNTYGNSLPTLIIGIIFAIFLKDWFAQYEAHRLWIVLGILPFFTHIVTIYATQRDLYTVQKEHTSIPLNWVGICSLICCVLIIYVALAMLLSTAWLGGDDFACTYFRGTSGLIKDYMGRISRVGEIVCHSWILPDNRYQVWLINPLFVLLAVVGIWRLNGMTYKSLFTLRGTLFVTLFVAATLLSVRLGFWRNFWCYAASTNYFWPSVATIWLLSFFNKDNWVKASTNKARHKVYIICVFLLGIFCGWGTEAGTCFLLPILTMWLLWHLYKKLPIAPQCWAAWLGAIWGAVMLVCSPATAGRTARSIKIRKLNPAEMPVEKLQEFLNTLTPQKLNLLRGDGGVVCLDGIPIVEHLRFMPFLAEAFWETSAFISCLVFLMLILTLYKLGTSKHIVKHVLIGAIGFIVAWGCACSYLIACIPSHMSFLPGAFIILMVAGYLYIHLPYKWIPQTCIAIGVTVYALSVFIPAGITAWEYKQYERTMLAEIKRQKDNGIKDVVVTLPFKKAPRKTLGLIDGMSYGGNGHGTPWRNKAAAEHFGVSSLTIERKDILPKTNNQKR